MSQELSPQRNSLEGEGFSLSADIIFQNKEVVTDFFGDNRQKWYSLLSRSSALRKKVSLSLREPLPDDINPELVMQEEEMPLDPTTLTIERSEHVAHFFKEYPEALLDFLEYSQWYRKSEESPVAKDESTP